MGNTQTSTDAETRSAGGRPPATYSDLAGPLFRDVVAPDFEGEVRDVVLWRHRWRKISNWVEGVAHVLLGAASILAFSAGFFDNKYLTYASACSSTVCLALLRFSAYANNESVERNTVLTRLLKTAGIAPMPDPGAPPVADPDVVGPEPDHADAAAVAATPTPGATASTPLLVRRPSAAAAASPLRVNAALTAAATLEPGPTDADLAEMAGVGVHPRVSHGGEKRRWAPPDSPDAASAANDAI